MFKNPLLIAALALTSAVAAWGIFDTQGLASFASSATGMWFKSRGWFVMLTVSTILIVAVWLAFSRYGAIKLGKDDDQPEFSTVSWLTMLFAAGMGVGLLYWAAAEPLTHYLLLQEFFKDEHFSSSSALFLTNFHWGLHAWAIYAITGLVIAYFGFRKNCPNLISAPIKHVFGNHYWTRIVGSMSDLLAIYAIAIGLGGSVAMGVFQIQDGLESLFRLNNTGMTLSMGIFFVLCICYIFPLMVDLGKGMALLSNTAMAICLWLLLFVLLTGPTYSMMNAIVDSIGKYITNVFAQGFKTYTFVDERVKGWFSSWTLTYMVWWLAWAPFVGVFIARISKGRTIREFIAGVVLAPTGFSIMWFGVFGGIGFYAALETNLPLLEIVSSNPGSATFVLLQHLPLSFLTISGTVIAAFLFVVTSVVSAAFVLSMFSTAGDLNPSTKIKIIWGIILGALGLVMILSGSIDTIKAIIALSAMPFIFIVLLLMVCLLKSLKKEPL